MEVFETRDESYWDSYLIVVEVFLAPNNFRMLARDSLTLRKRNSVGRTSGEKDI